MNRHKNTVINLLSPITNLINVQCLSNITSQKLIVPFYHAITNKTPSHLKYLYYIKNEKQFATDLDFLLKSFQPINLTDLIDIVKNNKTIARPVFHITFDDGLTEFHDIAAPILLKKGVPATCFLNSGFIDNKDIFFRMKASLLIDELHNENVGSPVWKKFHEFCTDKGIHNTYYRKYLLSVDYNNKYLLNELAHHIDIDFSEYSAKNKPYMTSDQIRNLIQKGFTFGAHSIDHPEYRFLNEDEQIRQTKESVDTICKVFNLNYKAFAFPFTDHEIRKSFFDKVFNENIIDISFGSAGIKKDSIKQNIQRYCAETEKYSMNNIIKNEVFYISMLKLVGKGKVKRN